MRRAASFWFRITEMCKTIRQHVKLRADPAAVYELHRPARDHQPEDSVGESDVTGINVDLVPDGGPASSLPEGIRAASAVAS
jgi:hypothetical protein